MRLPQWLRALRSWGTRRRSLCEDELYAQMSGDQVRALLENHENRLREIRKFFEAAKPPSSPSPAAPSSRGPASGLPPPSDARPEEPSTPMPTDTSGTEEYTTTSLAPGRSP